MGLTRIRDVRIRESASCRRGWLSDEFRLGLELEFDSAGLSNVQQCLGDLSWPQLVARWRH